MSIDSKNKSKISHILAIDFGKSKVGLAFSEMETGLAFALGIIPKDRDFFETIKKIVEEKEIDRVILGKPKWTEEERDWKRERLVDFIQSSLGIKVELVEEMFTSKMAQENMKEAGKKNISQDDSEAARIMLQDWLEENK